MTLFSETQVKTEELSARTTDERTTPSVAAKSDDHNLSTAKQDRLRLWNNRPGRLCLPPNLSPVVK